MVGSRARPAGLRRPFDQAAAGQLSRASPAAPAPRRPRHAPRNPRKGPTLPSVAKQASKAATAAPRYEVKPDGTVVIITGKPEPVEPENPWPLDGRRLREMHKQALGGLLVLAEVPNAPEERQARREASFRP